MHRINEVKVYEGITVDMLETEINRFIQSNRNLNIVDIKYVVYEVDIEPVYLDSIEDGKTKENRYSAMILIGEEI